MKNFLELVKKNIVASTLTALTKYQWSMSKIDFQTKKAQELELKSKLDILSKFKEYKAKVENQSNKTIKIVKSNLGGEFNNTNFSNYLKEKGII